MLVLEVTRRRVQDQRLLAAQVVGQHFAEAGAPSLGHAPGQPDRVGGIGLVIDREVIGPQHIELERPVPDLVASELVRHG